MHAVIDIRTDTELDECCTGRLNRNKVGSFRLSNVQELCRKITLSQLTVLSLMQLGK